eukprot:CAMPEP_0171751730 /NCGR_PEP_ID=MMETSP0991-20121206/42188_1 /TAXON_ID=483369 /ORGANISM="non described non described, Strain CCMP2098" /LENGTH=32 /DNA_ID= /DNA_START= /DNA_END= /DNA_ORIENTATION=
MRGLNRDGGVFSKSSSSNTTLTLAPPETLTTG